MRRKCVLLGLYRRKAAGTSLGSANHVLTFEDAYKGGVCDLWVVLI